MTRSRFLFLALSSVQTLAYGAPMNHPDIQMNPNPRMRYEITATVTGAPGPFDEVDGSVDYQVTNRQCVPLTPVTGAAEFPQKSVPIKLHRKSDNVYTGEIFADLLADENYFNRGICHWTLTGAGVNFHTGKVTFSADLFHDDIVGQKGTERFFSHRSYATKNRERIDTGNARREDFEDEASRTFSVTIQAREITP